MTGFADGQDPCPPQGEGPDETRPPGELHAPRVGEGLANPAPAPLLCIETQVDGVVGPPVWNTGADSGRWWVWTGHPGCLGSHTQCLQALAGMLAEEDFEEGEVLCEWVPLAGNSRMWVNKTKTPPPSHPHPTQEHLLR